MRPFLVAALLLLAPLPAQAGWNEGLSAYLRKDWPTAARELKPLAESGHGEAQARLGLMTLHGYGVARDPAAAFNLFQAAADNGDALAQNSLGGLYFNGIGTARDMSKALLWFNRAADQGQPQALNNLGQMYLTGNGVAKDESRALDLLRRAAERNVPAAWESLGLIYWNGLGVAADHAEAVRWLRKAAERGQMLAQNRLANALWSGDGTPRDRTEAVRWFEQAAAQGDGASLYHLSRVYARGSDAAKDPRKAAQYSILAPRYARPANKQRFEQNRDSLRATTPPDIWGIAEALARNWAPQKSRGGFSAHPEDLVPPPETSQPAPSSIREKAFSPESVPKRPQISTGSGVVVTRDGMVLTNSHVVRRCRNIRVSLEARPAQAATVVVRDDGNDLALLKTSLRATEVARFREDKPMRSGDSVVAIGYPMSTLLSREPNVTVGVISALAGIKGDKRHYQLTAPVQKGNSGGPVADMSGNVVGIVASKLDAMKVAEKTGDLPQNVNFAIKSELARRFLSDNAVSYDTAPATSQLSPADVGDIVKKVTAFVECEG